MRTTLQRFALRVLRWTTRDSNLVAHGARELEGWNEEPESWMRENILDMLAVFSSGGRSGRSAAWAGGLFAQLADFKPLGPLTGAEDEWIEVGDGLTYQNRRCSHVFKDSADGAAYDIYGIVWEYPDGSRTTSYESRTPVAFPYTPKSAIVKVNDEGEPVSGGL